MDSIRDTYENLKKQILEGSNDVNELANEYGLDDGFVCYFMILNPDHNNFDDNLSKLEMNYNMISAGYCDTKAGFIEDLGEVGRLGFFQDYISEDKIKEVLQDVLFDIVKVDDNGTPVLDVVHDSNILGAYYPKNKTELVRYLEEIIIK